MAFLWAGLWIAGAVPLAIVAELLTSESPRIVRAARISVALLGVDLLLAAVFFTIGTSPSRLSADQATRSIWWLTAIAGGIPIVLVSGWAVRSGYRGRRLVLAAATLLAAAPYLVFPLGFVPRGHDLTGLGRFAHEHHALGMAVLLVPTLILLVNELRWRADGAAPGEVPHQPAG